MITVQKLNNLQQKVEYCLERYPVTRNSDLELMAQLCERFYPPWESAIYNWRDYVSIMRTLPTLDHIARARRKVIEKHNYTKYLPTIKEVAEARKYSQFVWEEYIHQQKGSVINTTASLNVPEDMRLAESRDEL